MLVAIVTAPIWPASATIWASAWARLAFALSTLCLIPARVSSRETCSEASTLAVPTRIGWPVAWISSIRSRSALYLARFVL